MEQRNFHVSNVGRPSAKRTNFWSTKGTFMDKVNHKLFDCR